MKKYGIAVSMYLALMGVQPSAEAQSITHLEENPIDFCWVNHVEDPLCLAYVQGFNSHAAQLGAGNQVFAIPSALRDELAPHYPDLDLDEVRFGFSAGAIEDVSHPVQNATALCDVIYFNDPIMVDQIRNNNISFDDYWHWLFHELRHLEQAVLMSSCGEFAYQWIREIVELTGTADLSQLTEGDWVTIHDMHSIEFDADQRANQIQSLWRQDYIPHTGDFDGDGWGDTALWRVNGAVWYGRRVTGITLFNGVQWGKIGDISLVGDFDGDGQDDLGIWRPSNGKWYAKRTDNTVIFRNIQWGEPGDIPLVGDFDGDGQDDLGIWRPSNRNWYAKRADGSVIFRNYKFGSAGDVPVVGDFDGDGQDDIGLWRPSSGKWYAKRMYEGSVAETIFYGVRWGVSEDIPLVGDFDGDGQDDLGIWRPKNGRWFGKRVYEGSVSQVIFRNIELGGSGDIPLVSDFDGDGQDDLGIWQPLFGDFLAKRANGTSIYIPD